MSGDSLFDVGIRTRPGPARFGEPSFTYLNESKRLPFDRVRNLMDEWFAEYPVEHRADLRARFRSTRSRQHAGAFFELYLYALCNRIGFRSEAHPLIPSGDRPDFLIHGVSAPVFYLEGIAADEAGQDSGENTRKERIHQVFAELIDPNFMLGIGVEQVPKRDLSRRDLVPPVRSWLANLDPDAPRNPNPVDPWPRKILEGSDWRIVVEAIARKPEKRGTPLYRGVGTLGPYGGVVEPSRGLRDALRAKAKQFPPLKLPLVVAVNCLDSHIDDWAIKNALFGSEQVISELLTDGTIRWGESRAPDGAWWRGEPVNQRISAVLILRNLQPWSVTNVAPELWFNPWPDPELAVDAWPLAARVPDRGTGTMTPVPSRLIPLSGIFGLPADWPGDDD